MSDDNARTLADDRRRLLHEMEVERNQVWRNIEWCRIRDIDRPFVARWSLKDIVGHLTTHESEVVTAFRDLREGRRPTYFDITDIDRWNHDHVERKQAVDFWSLLEQLRGSRTRLLEELALVSNEDLTNDATPENRLVRSVIEHDRAHWHEIAARLAGMEGARPASSERNPAATTASP
ncbi:MAG: hypothetical protein M0R74_16275 [Dehalococcoidia bacterium]|nr:hypothetical protein [Dehalococcoidia bacterium]